jgi:hypothetical protein
MDSPQSRASLREAATNPYFYFGLTDIPIPEYMSRRTDAERGLKIYFPAFYFSFGARPAGSRYYQIYMLREYKPVDEVADAGIKKYVYGLVQSKYYRRGCVLSFAGRSATQLCDERSRVFEQ